MFDSSYLNDRVFNMTSTKSHHFFGPEFTFDPGSSAKAIFLLFVSSLTPNYFRSVGSRTFQTLKKTKNEQIGRSGD